jgi:hypothetical protein
LKKITWRQIGGAFLMVVGALIILTPFTPGSILFFIGLELVFGERVKWLKDIERKIRAYFKTYFKR